MGPRRRHVAPDAVPHCLHICPPYAPRLPTRDCHRGGVCVSVCLRVHASVGETRRKGITEGSIVVDGVGRDEGMFPLLVYFSVVYFFS
uniref:Uncharacterized protein n=1 Tax=Human betaherpesvirus 6 TaxID=10368 RepID=A0A1W6G4A6_9BETA|nr:hypothetical protein [Human betaherpesvirus 6]AVQ94002.2 hypothetical protein [Human betaherpesvirus 6]